VSADARAQAAPPVTPATREAYRECEAITRATAANFSYGIRLLAPSRRRAMCAVYAFARRVDDIGDGTLAREEKLRRLDAQARALAALPGGAEGSSTSDPVMVALADAYVRFYVPPDALQALIAGVRMDVEGVRYESFDELVLYCRRVAGAIGRACLAIFALRDPAGTDRAAAQQLADDLGVALQLTNILRDVREDALSGRVYLPAEDLRRFGLIAAGEEREQAAATIAALANRAALDGHCATANEERADADWLGALVRFQADRARTWFDRGMTLAPLLDRRSAACLLAMAGIYSRLLTRIAADPERALRERVSLPMREKAWVAARSMLGGGG
jgi:phytoene synthase